MTLSAADLLKQMEGLDANEIALLVTLYQFADAGGTCFPSHETIAARLGRTRQWVCLGLKRLEEKGRIKVTRRRIPKRGQTSSVYSLPTAVRISDSDRCTNSVHEAVRNSDTKKTHDSKTHTHSSGGGRVVNMPLPIPQGWGPSAVVVQQAMLRFPNITDQDLADHSAKFISRCRAKPYVYADYDSAWMEWLLADRKEAEAKEKANAGRSAGRSNLSAAEQRRDRLAVENRETADYLKAKLRARGSLA